MRCKMVDSIGNNQNIKLKGLNVQLNDNNVKGLVLSDKTPIFIKKYDEDDDGILNQKEAAALLKDLQKAAKNDTLSARELEKAKLGKKTDLKNPTRIGNEKYNNNTYIFNIHSAKLCCVDKRKIRCRSGAPR